MDAARPPPDQMERVRKIQEMLQQRQQQQQQPVTAGNANGAPVLNFGGNPTSALGSVVTATNNAFTPKPHDAFSHQQQQSQYGDFSRPAQQPDQQQQQQHAMIANSNNQGRTLVSGAGVAATSATNPQDLGSIGMVNIGNPWINAPQHPTAIAALRVSPFGMQPGVQGEATNRNDASRQPLKSKPQQTANNPFQDTISDDDDDDTAFISISQADKQQAQLSSGALKVLNKPQNRGRRTMRPWPSVPVPQLPPNGAMAASTAITDLVQCPQKFIFGAYDGHLTQYYEIPPQDVAVTIGAVRYIEHHNQCGPYSTYRFQVCHNFFSGKCRKGVDCTYIHMIKMPTPHLIHVMSGIAATTSGTGNASNPTHTDRQYPMLPAGMMVPIYAPHSTDPPQVVPSESIIKTEGAKLLMESLLSSENASSEAKKVASRPQHCAHFQFRKVCNRGAACTFIHCTKSLRASNSNSGQQPPHQQQQNQQHQQQQQQQRAPTATDMSGFVTGQENTMINVQQQQGMPQQPQQGLSQQQAQQQGMAQTVLISNMWGTPSANTQPVQQQPPQQQQPPSPQANWAVGSEPMLFSASTSPQDRGQGSRQ